MKKAKKTGLIISISSIVLGLVIAFSTFAVAGFDFRKMMTLHFEKRIYVIEDEFDKIEFSEYTDDIEIVLSDDGKCKVECYDNDKIHHIYDIDENKKLYIRQSDDRKWYEHLEVYYKENEKITLYLPKKEYQELCIENILGDISVSEEFTFDYILLKSADGTIDCQAKANNEMIMIDQENIKEESKLDILKDKIKKR